MLNQFDICNHVFAPEDCICHPVASGEKCFQKGREALSPEASSVTQAISQAAKLPWVPVIPSCSRKALSDALSPFSLSAPLWGGQDRCHSHRINNPSPQDWLVWDPMVRAWWRWGRSLGFLLIIQSFSYTPISTLGAWRWLSSGRRRGSTDATRSASRRFVVFEVSKMTCALRPLQMLSQKDFLTQSKVSCDRKSLWREGWPPPAAERGREGGRGGLDSRGGGHGLIKGDPLQGFAGFLGRWSPQSCWSWLLFNH